LLRIDIASYLLPGTTDCFPERRWPTAGYGIVALFVVSWGLSFLIYRFKRYDFNPGLDRF
jgi:hypothetical protein